MALFAIMSVGVASLMRETTRVSQRVDSRQETVLSAQLSLERLSRELAHAYRERLQREETRFIAREPGDLIFSFLDSPLRVLFERRSPGVKLVHYFLEDSPGGAQRLMRAEVPINLHEDLELQEARLVADGILSFQLEFYDARNDQWTEAWDSEAEITFGIFPQMVRVTFKVVDTRHPEEQWPTRALTYQTTVFVLNEYEEPK
jgi:hypothetical protein